MVADPFVIERLLAEGPLPLCVLRLEVVPGRGKARSMSTLVKWVREGVLGVRLEAYHDGTRWFSSRPALARFLAALTGREAGPPEGPAPEARRKESLQRRKERMRRLAAEARRGL